MNLGERLRHTLLYNFVMSPIISLITDCLANQSGWSELVFTLARLLAVVGLCMSGTTTRVKAGFIFVVP